MNYTNANTYLTAAFGKKMYRLSLNAGFSCPNRDGTIGNRGCSFCSAGGSGEFAASPLLGITEQLEEAKKQIAKKLPKKSPYGYIAYFQAFTNTYAPVERLREVFTEAMDFPGVEAISIATRPDCLPDEVLDLLAELRKRKPIYVELGLQTIHEKTAERIRRGYPLPVFEEAVRHLSDIGIPVIVHLILGLPDETPEDMLESVRYVSGKTCIREQNNCGYPVHGLKLQLLHILKGTDLATEYLGMSEEERKQSFPMMSREAYLDMICRCLEIIPKEVVIYRLTGDGDKRLLLAPKWSGDKKGVLNALNKKLGQR